MDKKKLPHVSKERLKELKEEGRKLREAVRKRLAPLLNVSYEKMHRRLK
jgi:hypothetical protein